MVMYRNVAALAQITYSFVTQPILLKSVRLKSFGATNTEQRLASSQEE